MTDEEKTFKEISSLIYDNLDNIIRYGEYEPTDEVLDLVLQALMLTEPAADIYFDAVDGSHTLAAMRIEAMLSGKQSDKDAADRREANLLREYAKGRLNHYEDLIWHEWHEVAGPLRLAQ
jgi:hypothetical protein